MSLFDDTEPKIIKRTPKGKDVTPFKSASTHEDADTYVRKINPKNPPADIVLTDRQIKQVAKAGAVSEPFKLEDELVTPENPISDLRIENFLMSIIENNCTTADDIYVCYKRAGFNLTGERSQDMNSMRVMMRKPRVRERLKFLRESEWELIKPNNLTLKHQFENILNDDYVKPSERLTAIESLGKLSGDLGKKNTTQNNNSKTVIVFNSSEAPKSVSASQDGKTITVDAETKKLN